MSLPPPCAGRCRHRSRLPFAPLRAGARPAEQGFLLPVAFVASLLLLLGALSLQALILQGRVGLRLREIRGQQEDALSTAAQQLVAALNSRHACLLALPRQRWQSEGGLCASAADLLALEQGVVGARRWQLIDWQPAASRAKALIELDAGASPGAPRRGSFAVTLLASPPRALAPGLLGLRGVAP
ncbi:MAG: hypothetical protein ACKOZT_13705 [Cyanobium sp.]